MGIARRTRSFPVRSEIWSNPADQPQQLRRKRADPQPIAENRQIPVENLHPPRAIDCCVALAAISRTNGVVTIQRAIRKQGGNLMVEVLKPGLLAALMLSAPMAHAGGPVIIEEGNDELIEEQTGNAAGILPVLGILLIVGLLASSGGGGDPAPAPGPAPGPAPDPAPPPEPSPEPDPGKW
jgi:hypothetical protein